MPRKPLADEGEICPLHKVDMSQVCHKCPWWIMLRGQNPNTGVEVDDWGCAVQWMPVLLVENAKEIRQTAAATESFRNEMVEANKVSHKLQVMQIPAAREEYLRLSEGKEDA